MINTVQRSIWSLVIAVAAVVCGCAKAEKPMADVIITNAHVWTVDRDRPTAEAIAIKGERIAAVGTRKEIEAWRGATTRTIDAKGRLVMPGFNDAHVHLGAAGRNKMTLSLTGAATMSTFMGRAAASISLTG